MNYRVKIWQPLNEHIWNYVVAYGKNNEIEIIGSGSAPTEEIARKCALTDAKEDDRLRNATWQELPLD